MECDVSTIVSLNTVICTKWLPYNLLASYSYKKSFKRENLRSFIPQDSVVKPIRCQQSVTIVYESSIIAFYLYIRVIRCVAKSGKRTNDGYTASYY